MNRKSRNILGLLCLVALNQPFAANAQTTPKVETLSTSEIKAGAGGFKGSIQYAEPSEDEAPKAPLFQKYGDAHLHHF